MPLFSFADPVLTCQEAVHFEKQLLDNTVAEWLAMLAAGRQLAETIVKDSKELAVDPSAWQVLALVGKGHNGGDTLLACWHLLQAVPRTQLTIYLSHPSESMRPNTRRALERLQTHGTKAKVEFICEDYNLDAILESFASGGPGLCIDGLLGFNFTPPLRAPLLRMITAVNACRHFVMRAAVDLPTGLSADSGADAHVFKADFVYATGIAKIPLFLGNASRGRIRYLDLDFFSRAVCRSKQDVFVLNKRACLSLQGLRKADVDKRSYGHVLVVGGSLEMPGALLLCVQAAIRSGVGRVTVLAPRSLLPHLSIAAPEAMWIAGAEDEYGQLAATAFDAIVGSLDRFTACVCGPGLGSRPGTQILVKALIQSGAFPLLLDADALQPKIVSLLEQRASLQGKRAVVLTPHMGEWMRLRAINQADYAMESLRQFSKSIASVTVLKCAQTRFSDGEAVFFSPHGGPVLARGGSGDLLAGLIAGQLAQPQMDPLSAVACGVAMHGQAADALAIARGGHCVAISQLLDYLSPKMWSA